MLERRAALRRHQHLPIKLRFGVRTFRNIFSWSMFPFAMTDDMCWPRPCSTIAIRVATLVYVTGSADGRSSLARGEGATVCLGRRGRCATADGGVAHQAGVRARLRRLEQDAAGGRAPRRQTGARFSILGAWSGSGSWTASGPACRLASVGDSGGKKYVRTYCRGQIRDACREYISAAYGAISWGADRASRATHQGKDSNA